MARATWAGLSVPDLAKRAELVPSTIYRAIKNGDMQVSTLYRLLDALTAYELALRDHLVALHGLPADAAGNGNGASHGAGAAGQKAEAAA